MSDEPIPMSIWEDAFAKELAKQAAAAEARGRQQMIDALRPLLDSWYHDPDCQVGRRELNTGCAHFDDRWRHKCREEVLAALESIANQATPDTPTPRGYDYDTEGLGGT